MTTEHATKIATQSDNFVINFSKKDLSVQALRAFSQVENLRQMIDCPLMAIQLKPLWRASLIEACYKLSYGPKQGAESSLSRARMDALNNLLDGIEKNDHLSNDKRPILSLTVLQKMHAMVVYSPHDTESVWRWRSGHALDYWQRIMGADMTPMSALEERMNCWCAWVNSPACLSLAPEYRALLAVFYLQSIHPFETSQASLSIALLTYLLRRAGFGDMAEGVAAFFCQDEHVLSTVFIATQKSQHLHYFQSQWILHYLTALEAFLIDTQQMVHQKHQQALFDQARFNGGLNERQQALIEQLMVNKTLRDKKALSRSAFYRALYIKQSRRTQERDFKIICDKKLIIMIDVSAFKLATDL